MLNWIDGLDHTGQKKTGVPAIFGMNFQEVSVGQKLAGNGYTDVLGTPSSGLKDALNHTDQAIGKMMAELQKRGLSDSTLIIITSKHGQSPIDINKRVAVDDGPYSSFLPGLIAQLTDDDVALIWLTDQSQANNAVGILSQPANEASLGIQEIYGGKSLELRFNNSLHDPRTPDIAIQPNYGVIYMGGSKIAEHRGFSEDDTHVALLISAPSLRPQVIKSPVETTQVAPTILQALGLPAGIA